MRIHNGSPATSLGEVVLFALDDHSLPFQTGVELRLSGYKSPSGSTRIVLEPGEKGAPDCRHVAYYGSVHRVGEELWMWYLGQGEQEDWLQRVCFAKSKDGYQWEKPSLGLLAYRGSRDNNLVDLGQGSYHVQACVVFHDPDDTDSQRRFKMAFMSPRYENHIAAAFSPDGIRWREAENPVGEYLEMGGGVRFHGIYYLTGQGCHHPPPARQLITYVSHDFERWTESFCVGLRRGDPLYSAYGLNSGEQVHLGAAMWNRGNVIIGFYGKWNGHPSNDRRLVSLDLGLAVTNDGLHYREPIPDFPMVSAAEDGWGAPPLGDPRVKPPALMQGQGVENVGAETLFWYGPWPEQGGNGVRVARWERDRLGYFRALATEAGRGESAHVTSAPIDLERSPVRVFLNVDGIGPYSRVAVEVLDERFAVLPQYAKANCLSLEASGLRREVRWRGRKRVETDVNSVRLRVHFEGVRAEDVKLYAVYLEAAP